MIHPLTPKQQEELAGNAVFDLKDIAPDLAGFLANTPDDDAALAENAEQLISLCHEFDAVLLPCGSPKFVWVLSQLWLGRRVKAKPLFAHSERVSTEKAVNKFVAIDGTETFRKEQIVEKSSSFNHVRFF